MSHDLNPTSLPADAVPDERREIVSLVDVRGELGEIFALAEVLLACEGQFFEMHSSFAVMLAALVNRIRRLQGDLEFEGVPHA